MGFTKHDQITYQLMCCSDMNPKCHAKPELLTLDVALRTCESWLWLLLLLWWWWSVEVEVEEQGGEGDPAEGDPAEGDPGCVVVVDQEDPPTTHTQQHHHHPPPVSNMQHKRQRKAMLASRWAQAESQH